MVSNTTDKVDKNTQMRQDQWPDCEFNGDFRV